MPELTIYFVRHGLTKNNAAGRVQGRKDTLLSEEGRRQLHALRDTYSYPAVERVYSSPAARARETAAILYPDQEPVPVEGFWEYSFGVWEGRPMTEIAQTPPYQKWLDQDMDCKFEGGESLLEASFRARAALTWVIQDAFEAGLATVAVVAHGEIFSLLFRATLTPALPQNALLCPNGMGVVATADPRGWFQKQTLAFQSFFPKGAPRPKLEDSPYFQNVDPKTLA